MRHAIDRLGVKGSVLVIRKNHPWLKYATSNKADTSYLINSVQKSMTATMIMREVQKGKLKLSTKLSKFYPNIPGSDLITIKDLLNMTSGLDLKSEASLGSATFISDKNTIKNDISKTIFNSKKLGKWHYTSVNYVYLCGILTKLEHKNYEQLFKATFIDRLNLKHTQFLWTNKSQLRASNWVPGYEQKEGHYLLFSYTAAVKDAHDELGAGSIVMSNNDLAKTMRAILTGKLLTNASRKALFKGHAPKYYSGGFYNLPHFKVANGAGSGYYTFFRSDNNGHNMLIIQSNKTKPNIFFKLRKKINAIMSIMLNF